MPWLLFLVSTFQDLQSSSEPPAELDVNLPPGLPEDNGEGGRDGLLASLHGYLYLARSWGVISLQRVDQQTSQVGRTSASASCIADHWLVFFGL